MLNLTRLAAVLVLAGAVLVIAPSPAQADPFGDTRCDNNPSAPGCDVTAGNPGGGSEAGDGDGGRGGDGTCRNPQGEVIPCEREGGWAGADGCYYSPAYPSSSTVAGLGGQPAGSGAWYLRTCYVGVDGGGGVYSSLVWLASPPVMSPEVLARQARDRLDLPSVVIEVSPDGVQLVNLPVWLSVARSSWEPQSATASVPGVSVTATARPVKARWVMGDGATVMCDGPGTVWTAAADPAGSSPDCGHRYTRSSAGAPGGTYRVAVTVVWEVTWAGAGRSGTVPGLTTSGGVPVRVQESQAVVTG
jgi:hypothetical protein